MRKKIYNMNYFFANTYYDFLDGMEIKIEDDTSSKDDEDIIKNIIKEKAEKDDALKQSNQMIADYIYDSTIQPFPIDGECVLEAIVQYPGLLIGTGNIHALGVTGEIGLGFTFDYVTGLPYLSGSTVKGILKSAFKYDEWISEQISTPDITFDSGMVKYLMDDIFENKDIFLDSFVYSPENKKIMNLDYLAPHHMDKKLGIFGPVNVLTMLRVCPGTTMRLRFILTDSEIPVQNGKRILFNADEKLKLFKCIIETFGVGAKTNVGYGHFSDVKIQDS